MDEDFKQERYRVSMKYALEYAEKRLEDRLRTQSNKIVFGKIKIPELIHHYCPLATGIEILKNKELWLSSIEKMNDTSETNCFDKIVYNKLDEYMEAYTGKEELGQDAKFMCKVIRNKDLPNKRKVFACSFSKKSDLLSQWRAYGDKGKGLSIAFATKNIDATLHVPFEWNMPGVTDEEKYKALRHAQSLFLVPSIYGECQKKVIECYIKAVFKDSNPMHICGLFDNFTGFFKHEAFSEEKEWRLLYRCSLIGNKYKNPPWTIEYRADKRGIVPYSRWIFDPKEGYKKDMPIAHITLGPQNDTLAEDMRSFLASVGLDKIAIFKSTIPYRD